MSDPESQADQTKLTAVEEAYREGNNELPPAALDAAVLAQAHAKKFDKRGRWTSPRWIMGLATAAALMLTVSVYRNVELETDLLRDTQSKSANEPGRIESNRNLPNELDDNSLREAGGTAAEAKVYRADQSAQIKEPNRPPAPALVRPSAPTPEAPSEPPPAITKAIEALEVKEQQPVSPQRSNVPAAVDIEIARDNDADSVRAKLRSQLRQKSASTGRILEETEESRQEPVPTDETICKTQFTFPPESGEHVVRDNWLSYRLNGTVHTWRCTGGSWAEVPLESDQ